MKISIIIPTIGRETLPKVLESIESCSDFSRHSIECLVIFDNVAVTLQNIPSWVRIFTTKTKTYSAGARNIGLDNARGDIIAFLGDDTYPDEKWLQRMIAFHTAHPQETKALLGFVAWDKKLANDPFHQWLLNHAQFQFHFLRHNTPSWRHFYTSNISLKRSIIGTDRFSLAFQGWGFEDTEFGYRLYQKGFSLFFDPIWTVYHDHKQTPQNVWNNTRNARSNAAIFEKLHPEVLLLPRKQKKIILAFLIFISTPFSFFIPSIRWWRSWKKAWL